MYIYIYIYSIFRRRDRTEALCSELSTDVPNGGRVNSSTNGTSCICIYIYLCIHK